MCYVAVCQALLNLWKKVGVILNIRLGVILNIR